METHEDDDLVDSINELWREMAADRSHHQLLGLRFHLTFAHIAEVSRTKVTRHNNDSVAEVNDSTLTVRKSPVVQNLQEKRNKFPASLLDLIYEHDAVGLAANIFRQLSYRVDASESRSKNHRLSGKEAPTS